MVAKLSNMFLKQNLCPGHKTVFDLKVTQIAKNKHGTGALNWSTYNILLHLFYLRSKTTKTTKA